MKLLEWYKLVLGHKFKNAVINEAIDNNNSSIETKVRTTLI